MILTQAEVDQLFMDVSEVAIWTAISTPPDLDVETDIDVIFTQPGSIIKQGGQEIIAEDTSALCKSYQVSEIKRPDTLTIREIEYGIINITEDGNGMTMITLGTTVR